MKSSRYSTRIDATGPNGNVFAIIGAAVQLMRQLPGMEPSEIDYFRKKVMAAKSYKEAVALVREWFPVDLDDEP